jgi:hypothetical protein
MENVPSPLRKQVIDALRRARRLPIGPERNDLRQLALGLRWLERKGLEAKVLNRAEPSADLNSTPSNADH